MRVAQPPNAQVVPLGSVHGSPSVGSFEGQVAASRPPPSRPPSPSSGASGAATSQAAAIAARPKGKSAHRLVRLIRSIPGRIEL
jgi:hypothetical protein